MNYAPSYLAEDLAADLERFFKKHPKRRKEYERLEKEAQRGLDKQLEGFAERLSVAFTKV